MARIKRREEIVKKAEELSVSESNAYNIRMRKVYLDAFVRNKLNGNYHAVRAKAILEQIERGEFGLWNGIFYGKESLEAEYWLAKYSAIKSFAGAQVAQVELVKLGMSLQDILAHFSKFMDSSIFRDDYSSFMDDTDDKTPHFVDSELIVGNDEK